MGMMLQRPFHAGQDAGERSQPPALALGGALDVGRIGDHRHLQAPEGRASGSLATTTRSMTCGRSRSTTCATIGRPPSRRSGFSTPGAHAPALAARQDDADQGAGAHRPEMLNRFALTAMAALCEALRKIKQGEELMAFSIAKVANWLHQVDKARAVVGWWPAQFATDDERTRLQGAGRVPEEAGRQAGPAGRLQDRADLAADPGSRPACKGPAYGPIRKKRVFEHKAIGARRPLDAARRRARDHPHRERRRAAAEGQALRQGLDRRSTSARRAPASS